MWWIFFLFLSLFFQCQRIWTQLYYIYWGQFAVFFRKFQLWPSLFKKWVQCRKFRIYHKSNLHGTFAHLNLSNELWIAELFVWIQQQCEPMELRFKSPPSPHAGLSCSKVVSRKLSTGVPFDTSDKNRLNLKPNQTRHTHGIKLRISNFSAIGCWCERFESFSHTKLLISSPAETAKAKRI